MTATERGASAWSRLRTVIGDRARNPQSQNYHCIALPVVKFHDACRPSGHLERWDHSRRSFYRRNKGAPAASAAHLFISRLVHIVDGGFVGLAQIWRAGLALRKIQ